MQPSLSVTSLALSSCVVLFYVARENIGYAGRAKRYRTFERKCSRNIEGVQSKQSIEMNKQILSHPRNMAIVNPASSMIRGIDLSLVHKWLSTWQNHTSFSSPTSDVQWSMLLYHSGLTALSLLSTFLFYQKFHWFGRCTPPLSPPPVWSQSCRTRGGSSLKDLITSLR